MHCKLRKKHCKFAYLSVYIFFSSFLDVQLCTQIFKSGIPENSIVDILLQSCFIIFLPFFCFRCNHDVRNKLGTRLEKLDKIPFKGLLKKMGNKLSCSCGPLKIKGYRYDASKEPWGQMMQNATDDRHIIR